jgi:hypothetical protein
MNVSNTAQLAASCSHPHCVHVNVQRTRYECVCCAMLIDKASGGDLCMSTGVPESHQVGEHI